MAVYIVLSSHLLANQEKYQKTCFLNMYYGNIHMECYYYCQQYEYYFDIIDITGKKKIFFPVIFLKNGISYCWYQYKEEFDIFF